jgi:hypothetical protein
MTGRIVYTPTPLHDCQPPAGDLDLQGRVVGTKWQCDRCWQIWSLDQAGAGKRWRRDGNPHCAVVANREGDLVSVPGSASEGAYAALYRPKPRLMDPYQQRPDFDASRVALWLILGVIATVIIAITAIAAAGGFS